MNDLEHHEDGAAEGRSDLPLEPRTGGDVVITTDARGRVTGLNRVAEALLGRSSAAARGAALADLFVIVRPETEMPWTDLVQEIIKTGTYKGLGGRAELISQAGRVYPIADEVTPILDNRSGVTGLALVFENTAERVRLQEAEPGRRTGLGETAPGLRAVINALPGLVNVVDRDFNVLIANDVVVRRFGQNRLEEVIGKKCHRVFKGLESICPQCTIQRAMDNDELVVRVSTREEERDRGIVTKAYAVPLKDERGRIWGGVEVIMDVTDLTEAETALRENEPRLRILIDQAADAVYLSDMQGRILEVNQRAVEQLGYTREELLRKTVMELDKDYPTLDQCLALWSGLEIGKAISFESRHVRRDGSSFPVEVRASAIEIKGEKQILGFVQDISERKKAEEQLKITQFGIDHAQVAVFQADDDANIYYANERACRDLGYSFEELTRLTIMDIDPTFNFERWKKHRATTHARGVISIETTHRRKDGSEFPVEVTINRMAFEDKKITFSFSKDISERKRSEAERRRFDEHVQKTQRLESLGVLAGGIAHDFNNLLGGIYGYIDLAREVSRDETVSQYLVKSLSSIDRARGLTRQLLTFSKGGQPVKKVMPLFPFVEETVRFALSGSRISCRFDVPDQLWPCDYDSNQLGQVVDNIVINAQQAMPMGGTLAVSAENVSLKETDHPALQAGGYVKLSFRDSGVGMPKEILSSIFDPFFTTKQVGSGLGLATCYSIVKRHNGHIGVVSEPGKGATFLVYLPASAEAAEAVTAPPAEPRRSLEERGRILIMDDERVVRDTTRAMCESLGYGAVSTSDGQEVMRVFAEERAAGRPFAAIVLDLTVPGGMGGAEAIHVIRKIDAEVPVFVSSGYADDPVMANPTRYGFTGSLCKPFRRSELAELLGRHLEG